MQLGKHGIRGVDELASDTHGVGRGKRKVETESQTETETQRE